MTLLVGFLLTGILTSWALSRPLAVSPRLVLVVTPPLLVAAVVAASTLIAIVPGHPLSVRQTTVTVFGLVTMLLALVGAVRNGLEELAGVLKSILPIALIGIMSAFIWWVSLRHQPPSDNDALVHAFTLRRSGEISGHPACFLPRDSTTLYGLRFVPCGAHLLGHLDWLRGFSYSWRTLNSVYLLAAFLLPVGTAAFLGLVRPDSRRLGLIGASSALVFLIFPYALNGVLPFMFGLVVALPTLGFAFEMAKRGGAYVLLSGAAVGGAAMIHPVAGMISLLGFIGLTRLPRFSAVRWIVSGVVLSLVLLFLLGPDTRKYLSDGLVAGNSASPASGTGLVEALVLGNDWTRAQPFLMLLGGAGLVYGWRVRGDLTKVISLLAALLYCVWLTLGQQNPVLRAIRSLFYGDWYRILGALELFLIPGVALALDRVMDFRPTRYRTSAALGTVLMLLMSTVTGLRIVSQAWSRPVSLSSETLKDFESVPSTLRAPVLNDPADGSAWAYVSSSLVLLAPVDRSPDNLYGSVIDDLPKRAFRQSVCVTIEDSGARYVSLMKSRTGLAEILRNEGVIDSPTFSGKELDIFSFSSGFLAECQREASKCVRRDSAPTWLTPLVEQRFRVPPDHVFCRD